MTDKLSDQWQTPDWLFKELDKEFHFDIDLCATKENSKCVNYGQDYLNDEYFHLGQKCWGDIEWLGVKSAFCNPPYSNPRPFIEKAWEDSKHCKIVCLVKCDPSTRWWATFWEYNSVYCGYCAQRVGAHETYCNYDTATWDPQKPFNKIYVYNGPKPGCEVRFFPKRIKFDPPACLDLEIKGNKYSIRCDDFDSIGSSKNSFLDKSPCMGVDCLRCRGTGKRWANLAGASFPCALLIFDRRGL